MKYLGHNLKSFEFITEIMKTTLVKIFKYSLELANHMINHNYN